MAGDEHEEVVGGDEAHAGEPGYVTFKELVEEMKNNGHRPPVTSDEVKDMRRRAPAGRA